MHISADTPCCEPHTCSAGGAISALPIRQARRAAHRVVPHTSSSKPESPVRPACLVVGRLFRVQAPEV